MFKNNLKSFYLYSLLFTSFIFTENISTNQIKENNPHVSLIVHEQLLNDFFKAIGKI